MIPQLLPSGLLPPGEHPATWSELRARFGGRPGRDDILGGIRLAALHLQRASCRRLWIDGSFVTNKSSPSDWDGCWDSQGVDPARMDPVLIDLSPAGRVRIKQKYRADLFPSSIVEVGSGLLVVNFFQVDKASGGPKGILLLDLTGWQP